LDDSLRDGAPSLTPLAVAAAGRRLRRKTVGALALSTVVPLAALIWMIERHIIPSLHGGDTANVWGLHLLLGFTGLAMTAGAWIIWDLGRVVARMSDAVATASATGLQARSDEVGTLVTSLASMLGTIERQAGDISQFSAQLDLANRELERSNAQLRDLSFKDEVTGLYNRRFFLVRLEEELSRFQRFNHPLSVVLLDLDGFKAVNDELGHAVGDETLREIAQVLTTHSRGINVVARYGGDEFAVLLVETNKTGAGQFAERIRQALAAHRFAHDKRITASVGIASLPDDGVPSPPELLQLADAALYGAKRAGKNRVTMADPG
jgi:diguanylate cyclase (GGDEF)-like protein